MITPVLEKLIWSGKAFFKTLVVGGSQRQNFDIQNDRFIIITDLTYFSSGYFPNDDGTGANNTYKNMVVNGMNTQLTILGEKGVNRFLFRNFYNSVLVDETQKFTLLPFGSTSLNTYILHTTQVAFSFSFAQNLNNQITGNTPGEFYALNPPLDYGRDGGTPIPVTLTGDPFPGNLTDLFGSRPTGLGNESREFSFPVDNATNIPDPQRVDSFNYPILHVNYVEIIGLPNNIGQ